MVAQHTYLRKAHEAEARERLRAFWAGSVVDRPALYITVQQPVGETVNWTAVTGDGRARDLNHAWHVFHARRTLNNTIYLAEAMPAASLTYASHLGLVAEIAGGEYAYDGGHAWVQPDADVYERPAPTFDPQHPTILALNETIHELATAIGRDGYINPPVFGLDSMTTLSLFRTPAQLCMDLLEIPGTVKSWSAAVDALIIECYEYFYQLISALGYGETSSWMPVMAEGRFEAVQCDFAVMLSPAMFSEFVLPSLRTFTDYLDYSLYHLDGTCQLRFLDSLCTLPRLNGIQWNPEPQAGSAANWLDAYRAIRTRNLCLFNNNVSTVDEAVTITKALGPDGLMIALPPFATITEAEEAIRSIEHASQTR